MKNFCFKSFDDFNLEKLSNEKMSKSVVRQFIMNSYKILFINA